MISLFEICLSNASELWFIQGIFIPLKYVIRHWLEGVRSFAYCSIKNLAKEGYIDMTKIFLGTMVELETLIFLKMWDFTETHSIT